MQKNYKIQNVSKNDGSSDRRKSTTTSAFCLLIVIGLRDSRLEELQTVVGVQKPALKYVNAVVL